jgi:sirohydrochlorin cobaltochelatase
MNGENFSDAVLVILGHGTMQNEGSERPVFQHAAELRRRGIFREVREAFWKQPPQVKDVLEGISAPRVFIVPLFVSEGYFASQVIPKELGFGNEVKRQSGNTALYYSEPVGTHPRMTDVILARAREVVEQFPFPRAAKPGDITLFIAGHGTERNEQSRQSIERQVELIRAKDIYADVHAVFMDENPRIQDCYSLAQTRNLVVVPFFMSDGLHTVEDIPVLLGEPERVVKERFAAGIPTWRNPSEKHGKLAWYSPAAGSAALLAEVILERVRETALRSKL